MQARHILWLSAALCLGGACGDSDGVGDAAGGGDATAQGDSPVAAGDTGGDATVGPTPAGDPLNAAYVGKSVGGNPYLEGVSADLVGGEAENVELAGQGAWVVGLPDGDDTIWVVALTDGKLGAVRLRSDGVATFLTEEDLGALPAGMPPVIYRDAAGELVIVRPPTGAATHTYPIEVDSKGSLAWVMDDGSLSVRRGATELGAASLGLLPDARLVSDGAGTVVALAGPTTRYEHGVLGDSVEAEGWVRLQVGAGVATLESVTVEDPQVVEGVGVLWEDLDGDGTRDVIATVSDAQDGARIVAWTSKGRLEGPVVGQGKRWRHQLVVAPFGPEGEIELVVAKTPHIGGLLEFYRPTEDGALAFVSTLAGYSTHATGSRNLDTALAVDLDADGDLELLVPNASRDALAVIGRPGQTAATEETTFPLPGAVTSNIAAVVASGGGLVIGVCAGTKLYLRRSL